MGIILILIIVGVVIYFIAKSSSGSKNAHEEQAPQQIKFEDLSDEELAARQLLFDTAMQGPNGAELTRCYDKIAEMFTPTKNGDFKGSLSGYIDFIDRAKKLSKTDTNVMQLLGYDAATYKAWYDTLYDNLLNSVYCSNNAKMANAARMVINDVVQGDSLLESSGALDKLTDPENINSKIKISMPDATIKLDIREKNGRILYEVKGAYDSFKTGLSLDEMERKAEILIAIGSKYNDPKFRLEKEDVEKYLLPSLEKLSSRQNA